jgi:predicted chitinase
VEIIKFLLDAEERRERMFVAFQKEQAEANREHELKMAQFFAQSSSQQHVLTKGISQILQTLAKNTDDD